MARNKQWRDDIPLPERGAWSVPQFAGLLGYEATYLDHNNRIAWNDTKTAGIISLPGIRVPVFKDVNDQAIVYRRHWEQAVDEAAARAAGVKNWNGTKAVEA